MNCRACDASLPGDAEACTVCGLMPAGPALEWTRTPEAEAFSQLREITDDEPLLGFARGRLVGDVPGMPSLSTLLGGSVYANVGISPTHLWVQALRVSRSGTAPARHVVLEFPAAVRISAEESDHLGVGSVARITMDFGARGTARLRSVGRFARLAMRLAECAPRAAGEGEPTGFSCAACGKDVERSARFCPFCGTARELEV
jgi:RNA polymerase subunit RPABC4/transcription elongation factor Spt4